MDNDDSDDTPRTHVTDAERAQHYAAYPPGALVIGESRPTPRNLFELELQERVKSLEDSRKFWRWVAGLGLPVLLTSAFAILIYSADKIAASSERVGGTAAKIEALEQRIASDKADLHRLLEMLDADIRELRRHAGLEPKTISIVKTP